MSGRVVLATLGSLGDLHPMIALGEALAARGHEVVIATSGFYREAVEAAGLEFHAVRPDVDPEDLALFERAVHSRKGLETVIREWVLPSLSESYEDTQEACAGADVIVSGDLAYQAPLVAEVAGIGWASVTLSPIGFLSAHDPPVLPGVRWLARLYGLGPTVNRIVPWFARTATRMWFSPVRRLRSELGLPPGGHPVLEGKHSDWLALAMFSRALARPQPDWPKATVVTGFAFHDQAPREGLPAGARAFLEADDPPIVFTLGSMAARMPGEWWEVAMAATREIGRRALLVLGPDPDPDRRPSTIGRDEVLALDYAPYSEIFPRAATIVHQGGIGTLGQALRAGRPQLVVPFAHDQFENAARARRIGVARCIQRNKWSAARAAEALANLLTDPAYERRAETVASVVEEEGGAVAAADAIEREFAEDLTGTRRGA